MSEEKKTSRSALDQLVGKHYKDSYVAKKAGKPVGWLTSVFPQELVEVFDLDYVYPENHCCVVGARKESGKFIDIAENLGYSIDICAYARTNLGYAEVGKSDALTIPLPDFICCCNNICNQVIKWYENLAKNLNIPLIMIDVTFNDDYEIRQSAIDYIKGQFQYAITQLEQVSGKKFDEQKFQEIMRISNENSRQWKAAMSMLTNIPSPMNGFDMFNYMALIVCNRGRVASKEVFELLEDEFKEMAAEGKGGFPVDEKFRIMWDGIAVWPYLSFTMKNLMKLGINMTASGYPDAFAIEYENGNLDGMARAYASIANSRNLEYQTDMRKALITNGKCDGAIYHMNRSCKVWDIMQYTMARNAAEGTNTPYAIFDGDQADPRGFSEAQFTTRIQGLAEVMDIRKEEVKTNVELRANH